MDGDTLTAINVTSTNGTIVNNGNGTWTFTPAANYNGTASLSCSVSDGTTSTPSSATINIAAVNDAPIVNAVTLNMNEDKTLIIKESVLLANASDVEGGTLSITTVTSPQGTLTYNGNHTWSFAPNANFNGTVDLSFTVSDGSATTTQALHVNVAAVNDAPIAALVTLSATEDTAVTFTTAQLVGTSYDVEGASLTVSNVTANHGAVVNNGNGTINASAKTRIFFIFHVFF